MKIFPNEIVSVANEIVLQNLLLSYSGIDIVVKSLTSKTHRIESIVLSFKVGWLLVSHFIKNIHLKFWLPLQYYKVSQFLCILLYDVFVWFTVYFPKFQCETNSPTLGLNVEGFKESNIN